MALSALSAFLYVGSLSLNWPVLLGPVPSGHAMTGLTSMNGRGRVPFHLEKASGGRHPGASPPGENR